MRSFLNIPFGAAILAVPIYGIKIVNFSQETYLLPPSFVGNNISQTFVDTETPNNPMQNATFAAARRSFFVSFDPAFDSLLDASSVPQLLLQRNETFALEAGVWVPHKEQVWFTETIEDLNAPPFTIYILDLATNLVFRPKTTEPVVRPGGGYYANGLVYLTTLGNSTYPASIVSIDPTTYETRTVVNSFKGLRLNGPDDVTWATIGRRSFNGSNDCMKKFMYFTDPQYAYDFGGTAVAPSLPDAVWRFDPEGKSLQAVISRADIFEPNGIRVNADSRILYVTDAPVPLVRGGRDSWGSAAIYAFDLDNNGAPINKRMIGLARSGVPDGMHIDDAGRIWTAESEGIVVRSKEGKELGIFNSKMFDPDLGHLPIANFALAGDVLVVFANTRLWRVKLAKIVVSAMRCETVGC